MENLSSSTKKLKKTNKKKNKPTNHTEKTNKQLQKTLTKNPPKPWKTRQNPNPENLPKTQTKQPNKKPPTPPKKQQKKSNQKTFRNIRKESSCSETVAPFAESTWLFARLGFEPKMWKRVFYWQQVNLKFIVVTFNEEKSPQSYANHKQFKGLSCRRKTSGSVCVCIWVMH